MTDSLKEARKWLMGTDCPHSGNVKQDCDQCVAALLDRVKAQARLEEFRVATTQRPIDPCYWDKHHLAALTEAAKEK